MRRLHARSVVVGAALLLVVVLGTVAWSFWTAGGAGAGSATAGTAQPVTLSPAAPTTQLYPGGQAAVEGTVTNPNLGPVRIESLSLDTSQADSGFALDAAHAACGVSALSFTAQTNGGAGWTVAGEASMTVSLQNALAMGLGAADACQGATITIYLKAGVS